MEQEWTVKAGVEIVTHCWSWDIDEQNPYFVLKRFPFTEADKRKRNVIPSATNCAASAGALLTATCDHLPPSVQLQQ